MIDPHGVEWLRAHEAAERFGIDADTVTAWVRRGKVEGHKFGRALYVRAPDVARCEWEWRVRRGGHPRHAERELRDASVSM